MSPRRAAPRESIRQSARDLPKPRQCLNCQATFDSQWAGERICPSCKHKAAWRTGAPARFHGV